jgi:hypothetical protein
MTDLRLADASVAGLLAFWSLIHIPDETVPSVFGHFRRALRPGGPLLLGFHAGDGSRLKTQGYGGHPMKVCVHRRQPGRVAAWLRDAGFTIEAQMLLDEVVIVPRLLAAQGVGQGDDVCGCLLDDRVPVGLQQAQDGCLPRPGCAGENV